MGSGLVDDTENIQSRNDISVLGSLSLRVVEVRRDSDNCICDCVSEICLGDLLYFGEDHGRDLFKSLQDMI